VVASTTSVVVIAFLVPLALLVRELAEDRAVSAATQEAQSVSLLVGLLGAGPELDRAVDAATQRSRWQTTVFLRGGRSVGDPGVRTDGVREAFAGRAFAADVPAGYEVLQPVATTAGRAVVRTFVPDAELRSGVGRAWLVLAGLGVGLIAVALVVADRLARRIASPLGDLADATRQLGEGRLDVRVAAGGPPEVVELGGVVNRLAGRIQVLLAAERELIADLSHRLRTPITALRLDTEGLRNPDEAERLGGDVDSLERAVDEVIRHARRPAEVPAVDAAVVVGERVRTWPPRWTPCWRTPCRTPRRRPRSTWPCGRVRPPPAGECCWSRTRGQACPTPTRSDGGAAVVAPPASGSTSPDGPPSRAGGGWSSAASSRSSAASSTASSASSYGSSPPWSS